MTNPFNDDFRITFDMIDPPTRPGNMTDLPRSPLSNITEEPSPVVDASAPVNESFRTLSSTHPVTSQFDLIEDKAPAPNREVIRWSRRLHPIGLAVIVLLIIILIVSIVALALASVDHTELDKQGRATAGSFVMPSTSEAIGPSSTEALKSWPSTLSPATPSSATQTHLSAWAFVQTRQTTVVTTLSPTTLTTKYTLQTAPGQSSTFTVQYTETASVIRTLTTQQTTTLEQPTLGVQSTPEPLIPSISRTLEQPLMSLSSAFEQSIAPSLTALPPMSISSQQISFTTQNLAPLASTSELPHSKVAIHIPVNESLTSSRKRTAVPRLPFNERDSIVTTANRGPGGRSSAWKG